MDKPQALNSNADPATDYSLLASLPQATMKRGFQASDLLEAASIRHCLVGDLLAQAVGSDITIGTIFLAVSGAQLSAAGALLSSTGVFLDAVCTYYRVDYTDDHFPGFVFVTEEVDAEKSPWRIMVVPASYWHLDLDPDDYAKNTVLLSNPRCRFPNKLHYIDALISVLVERNRRPGGWNGHITTSFHYQLLLFLICVPKCLIDRLPPEDKLFLDLFDKVMLPSAKAKVCVEWDNIRRGVATVEEARARIPRKDLAFKAFKADYEARMKAEAAKATESSKKENEEMK